MPKHAATLSDFAVPSSANWRRSRPGQADWPNQPLLVESREFLAFQLNIGADFREALPHQRQRSSKTVKNRRHLRKSG